MASLSLSSALPPSPGMHPTPRRSSQSSRRSSGRSVLAGAAEHSLSTDPHTSPMKNIRRLSGKPTSTDSHSSTKLEQSSQPSQKSDKKFNFLESGQPTLRGQRTLGPLKTTSRRMVIRSPSIPTHSGEETAALSSDGASNFSHHRFASTLTEETAVAVTKEDPSDQDALPNVPEMESDRGVSLAHLSKSRRESLLAHTTSTSGKTDSKDSKGLGNLKVSSAYVLKAVTVETPSHNPPPAHGSSVEQPQTSQAVTVQISSEQLQVTTENPDTGATLGSPQTPDKRASVTSIAGSPRPEGSQSPVTPDKRKPPITVQWTTGRVSTGTPIVSGRRFTGTNARREDSKISQQGSQLGHQLAIPSPTPRRTSVSGGATKQELHFEDEPCFKTILKCQKAECCATTNCCAKVVQKVVSVPLRCIHALVRNVGCRLFGGSVACSAGTFLCCLPGFIATCLTNCCRKRNQEKTPRTKSSLVDCAVLACYEPTSGCCGDFDLSRHVCEDGAVCVTTGMECCTYGSIGCGMAVESLACGICTYTGECVSEDSCCYSCSKKVNHCFMRCFKSCMCNSKSLEDTSQKVLKTHITHGRDFCMDFFPVWLVRILSMGGYNKRYLDFEKGTKEEIKG